MKHLSLALTVGLISLCLPNQMFAQGRSQANRGTPSQPAQLPQQGYRGATSQQFPTHRTLATPKTDRQPQYGQSQGTLRTTQPTTTGQQFGQSGRTLTSPQSGRQQYGQSQGQSRDLHGRSASSNNVSAATVQRRHHGVEPSHSNLGGGVDQGMVEADAQIDQTLGELEATHAQHIQVLQGLLTQVPPQARPAIEGAIANSQRGLANARSKRAIAQEKTAQSHGESSKCIAR